MAKTKQQEWWRGGVIYQVYPRSFYDSNHDGIGDLAGITAKLDYIKSLGVDAIWISPFFKSPMRDFGYDVSDYRDVDPIFGSMEDFDTLMKEATARDLQIMIDLVLNHSSTEHPWFKESRSSRDNPKADWYIWADPLPDGTPPNNWLSIFGGSAWEWDSTRRQYFLHHFLKSQADLNFHNAEVRREVLDIAKFWLDKGVHGFRLDTVNFYFHDAELRSNPPRDEVPDEIYVPDSNPYGMQHHIYDKSRPENLKFLEELRALMDQYPHCTAVGEIGDIQSVKVMAQYTEKGKRLHMAYSFALLGERFSPAYVRQVAERYNREMKNGWACWAFSNHDVTRAVTRWNVRPADQSDFAKLLVALLLTLRGSACIYQGEELGLPEADVPFERLQDPYGITFWPEYKGRDGCRTPMPWVATAPHAGFSGAEPWLPVPGEHSAHAADHQDGRPGSVLEHYRRFIPWRNQFGAFRLGDIEFIDAAEPLLAYTRTLGTEKILVVLNLGESSAEFDLSAYAGLEVLDGHGFETEHSKQAVRLEKYSAFFARVN